VLAILAAATLYDVRSRRVPAWLTGGGIAAQVLSAAWAGPSVLVASLGKAVTGGLVFLPFLWRRWLGGADALLLAAVGSWQAWRAALWTAWWTAAAGAGIALGVWAWRSWRTRRRTVSGEPTGSGARAEPFPYVPAILTGAVLTLLLDAGG
jgi:Flp pilus assembly protein protease CpaA